MKHSHSFLKYYVKTRFFYNNHNTTAFPVTAAKPDKENHSDRTMDAALLNLSFKQLIFMLPSVYGDSTSQNSVCKVLEICMTSLQTRCY